MVQNTTMWSRLMGLAGLVGALLVPANATAAQQGSACNLAYYQPVAAGASRTYNAPRSASGSITFRMTDVRDNGFDEDVQYQPAVSGSGGVVATTVQSADQYTCQNGALLRTRHEELATYSDGSIATVSFFDFDGPVLPSGLQPGKSWDVSFTQQAWVPDGVSTERFADHVTATSVESITVAAGTYKALRLEHQATTTPLDYEGEPHQTTWTEWVANGVGPVKDEGQALELAAISTSASAPSAQDCADLQTTIASLDLDASQRSAQVARDLTQIDQLSLAATADVTTAVANGSLPPEQLGLLQTDLAQLATDVTAFHSAADGQAPDVVFDESVQSLGRQVFADANLLAAQSGGLPSLSALQGPTMDLLQALSVGGADQQLIAGFTSARQGCP